MKRIATISLIAASMGALPLLSGCIERKVRFSLREPVNVPVTLYLDGEEMGELPADGSALESDFVHYGPREYTARADGYEATYGEYTTEPPWYEYPPMDFFANLWPEDFTYVHEVSVNMRPLEPVDTDALESRAENYRKASTLRIAEAHARPQQPQE